MEDSNWIKSAARFVIVVVVLAIVLFGGIYFLKNRNNTNSGNTTSKVSNSNSSHKKNNKKSKTSKESSSQSKQKSGSSGRSSRSSDSPRKVAPAGVSDYWYVPIIGASALVFGGYEYYLSRRTLKRSSSIR